MKAGTKIAIVDYGVGNLYSIIKAFKLFTDNLLVTEESAELETAAAIVLPGVGSFEAGIKGLRIRNLTDCLKKQAQANKPILGICLGAQLLLSKGYEFGTFDGLDIIKGKVISFPQLGKNVKIPHIGWNKIYPLHKNGWDNTILSNLKENSDFYFVHSFILKPENHDNILCLTQYENFEFCSVVRKGNIYGCQFHPEKSGKIGQELIKNFIKII